MNRKITKEIQIGKVKIGGNNPISVQSMTKTKTSDIRLTIDQILQLENAGCEIIRVAVPDEKSAEALAAIKKEIHIPLVADIHFNYKLALIAIEAGVDKIRINPGNIGDVDRIERVLMKAAEKQIPIRIGVNSGSIEKDLLEKYGHPCAEAIVESAMRHVEICEQFSFNNLVLSLKASDVTMMIDSYRLISQKVDYPLHLGVTEAGSSRVGLIKSSIGIGTLLEEGIGDTIRVSLTADPVQEVFAGIEILKALDLRKQGVTIISCPTCGRLEVDLFSIVKAIEDKVSRIQVPMKVAVMGCVVNGPGEASQADVGIACGRKKAVLFRKGEILKTVPEDEIVSSLLEEIQKIENLNS